MDAIFCAAVEMDDQYLQQSLFDLECHELLVWLPPNAIVPILIENFD